jgi:hypothetical protein
MYVLRRFDGDRVCVRVGGGRSNLIHIMVIGQRAHKPLVRFVVRFVRSLYITEFYANLHPFLFTAC